MRAQLCRSEGNACAHKTVRDAPDSDQRSLIQVLNYVSRKRPVCRPAWLAPATTDVGPTTWRNEGHTRIVLHPDSEYTTWQEGKCVLIAEVQISVSVHDVGISEYRTWRDGYSEGHGVSLRSA